MKRRKKQRNTIIISTIIVLLSILGISYILLNKDNEETSEGKKEPEKKPEVIKKLQIVDENSKTRPYGVMINNINVARQVQSGLQDAYLVYEIIVEGGITRYMALFQDQSTAKIGSIRSARHYFLDYALENDAIYVHHGQSPQAKSDFRALGIDRIEVNTSKTGWRDNEIKLSSEHRLFTNIEKLNKGLGKIRTTKKGDYLLNYSVDKIDMSNIPNAKEAKNISIKYSSSIKTSYTYDEEKGYYLRSVNEKAHTDYVTKEQYHVRNIITYQVKNYTLNDGENKGRQGIDNIGSGSGYYISDGYSIPIKWEKKSRESKTKYYYEDGSELKVNDGNTFIQIQPLNQILTIN